MLLMEEASVVKTRKNIIFVELLKNEKCAGCKACGMGRREKLVLPTYGEIAVSVGDRVRLKMPEGELKAAALFLYVLPLLCLFAGIMAGMAFDGEGFMFLFAGLFFLVSLIAVYFIDKAYRRKKKFLPQIIEKIEKTEKIDFVG